MDKTLLTRRHLMLGSAALGALGAGWPLAAPGALAQGAPTPTTGAPSGSLTYGISMSDLPLTTGQPDKGAGGYQFTGLTLYDPLIAWELDVSDRPGKMVPGLATTWESDPADRKNWTFHLRDGVKFHDGSAFDADAVIWNFDKVLNKEAPHFDQRQAAQVRPRLPGVASYKKLDAMTVQVTTKTADSLFPYQMLWFLISSPAQFEAVGRDWSKFAFQPSGTGPYKIGVLQPRVRLELVANEAYWNAKRAPKLAKLTLACVPEDLARVNALLSGNVDLIELPAPDAVPRLKAAGMRIVGNDTPHVWNYHLSMVEGSPWRDIRLRKAANLAIDRDGVVQLMGGLAAPAVGQVQASSPWFGKPTFQIKTDVAAAKKLVEEAGFSVKNPVKATILIPTGGTGQMLSLPINEFIQQSWAEIGIQAEFKTVELEVAYTGWRQGAADPSQKGISAGNIAYVTSDPFYAILRFYDSRQVAPNGVNWSHWKNAEVDALCDKVKASLDPAEQDKLLARIHEIVVDDAVQVWVVHDTNPHALSKKVKGYTQAQHWFQDLTTLA